MKKSTLTRWISVWLLLVTCLASGAERGVATDPRADLLRALHARGPHPTLGEHARLVDRLIGTWNVEYTDFSKSGKVTHRTGELIFGWIMDGRIVQDLWIVDPSGSGKERELYTDLFYFDPKRDTWSTAFVDPEHPSADRFAGATAGDDRLVLESKDFGTTDTRWSFNDIGPDSFVYRAEESSDGGKTWTLQSEYRMKRRQKP